jgi:uncharacterized protein with HEPN domain
VQRDILLLTEMTDAAEQAHKLMDGIAVNQLETRPAATDAMLWNFTVLGEAASQPSEDVRTQFPDITWQPQRLRNRIVHGYWSIDLSVLHTTATDQLPRFASNPRRTLTTLDQGT